MNEQAVFAELKRATNALYTAANAAITLAQSKLADDDGWSRLPTGKGRCPISNWSRSTILRRIEDGTIRKKQKGSSVFYSLADVQKHLKS